MDDVDLRVAAILNEMKSGSWKKLADSLGHNQGLLYNVANGHKRAPDSLIVTLGLTPRNSYPIPPSLLRRLFPRTRKPRRGWLLDVPERELRQAFRGRVNF